MKKIMFNDKYELTKAVLEGRKTMTRRLIPLTKADVQYLNKAFDFDLRESVIIDRYAKYKVGEVVAVAQAYKDIADNSYFANQCAANEQTVSGMHYEKGWNNKMYVASYYMPHHIQITGVKIERLQSISHKDCVKEGISERFLFYVPGSIGETYGGFISPREAFAVLIDQISGKGTWDSDPWVFTYSFELID